MSERVEYVEVPIKVAKPILDFLEHFKIDAKGYLEKRVIDGFKVDLQRFSDDDPSVFITQTYVDGLIERFRLTEVLGI